MAPGSCCMLSPDETQRCSETEGKRNVVLLCPLLHGVIGTAGARAQTQCNIVLVVNAVNPGYSIKSK